MEGLVVYAYEENLGMMLVKKDECFLGIIRFSKKDVIMGRVS